MTALPLTFVDEGDGPPVILLMGLGASASAWEPHIAAWSKRFRCIAVNNRGLAGSPEGDAPPTTAELARDVAALIEGLSITSCSVVGISMGAAIGQELAIARQELVDKLVLVAPWARCDESTASILNVLGRTRAAGDDPRTLNELLRNLVWTPHWVNEHADEMRPGLDSAYAMSAAAFQHQIVACTTHDAAGRLGRIVAPTLVTLGDADRFIRPELSEDVASRIPGSTIHRFHDSGHVHHWEQLDQFNSLVESFLV